MAYIYRHIRLDKNEPFYIGIGSDVEGKYKRANRKRIGPCCGIELLEKLIIGWKY